MSNGKCEMSRLGYCSKSSDGFCEAEVMEMELCPYLQVISENARLWIENMKLEDGLE